MNSKVIVKTDDAGELRYIICCGQYFPADRIEEAEPQLLVRPLIELIQGQPTGEQEN